MSKLTSFFNHHRFSIVSWAVTFILVAGMILGAFRWRGASAGGLPFEPIPTARPDQKPPQVTLPALVSPEAFASIEREILLKTKISTDKSHYEPTKYRVVRGDSVFAIADSFKLKPETVYWANYKEFNGSPASLQPGQELMIPPTDGVYYKWAEKDTVQAIADKFEIEPDAIIYWPGNSMDLTNPT